MTQGKGETAATLSLGSLKCVIFSFFGGLGCLLAFLPVHMREIGLTGNEGRIVSIIGPCVAIIGPLLVGPLSDRWGARTSRQYCRHMRVLLVTFLLIGAIAYGALLFVPKVSRLQERNPHVKFTCDFGDGFVSQEKCQETQCYNWPNNNFGSLYLSHCAFNCSNINILAEEGIDSDQANTIQIPPHICLENNGKTICHVYTNFTDQLVINVGLKPSNPSENPESDWCTYRLVNKINCYPPKGLENCTVSCDLNDPYIKRDSLLAEAKCQKTIGDDQLTFWSYLLLRSFADIFPAAVIALIGSCIITVCRDLPAGQFGALLSIAAAGIAIFPPAALYSYTFAFDLFAITNPPFPLCAIPILMFTVLATTAALIVLFDKSMPLSPVDYILHSNSGFLVMKGAGVEVLMVLLILVLLGILWSTLDSYLPWHLIMQLNGSEYLVALSLTAGALPAIPFLWYSESIVNYCGFSHLFITAFTFYIIRFTGLVFFENAWWTLLCEVLEVFTLGTMWATAMLYMKHLVSRHLTTTGQALPVIAHFCLGRSIGAVFGGVLSENDYLVVVYKISSVIAAVVASLYFIIYHCCIRSSVLKKRKEENDYRNPLYTSIQGSNTNGTYTPLKVYNKNDKSNNNQQSNRY